MPDRRISTAIKNAEKRRRAKRDAKEQEEYNKMYARALQGPGKPLPPHDSPKKRVKSELNVNKIDLSTNPTGGGDNSPNALEVGMKKAKTKKVADALGEGNTEKVAEEITNSAGLRKMGGQKAFYRMPGFPQLKEVPEENKGLAKLPEKVRNNMGFQRMNENMEMETVTPVNRHALQMIGRKGDYVPLSRMNSYSSFPKHSAAGKAKIKKTAYGQTGKAILNKNLIQPVYKKIYKDK